MAKTYTIIIEKDEETNLFVGEISGIPGCHSQGKTIDELIMNMQEVLELCLEINQDKPIELPTFVGVQQIEA